MIVGNDHRLRLVSQTNVVGQTISLPLCHRDVNPPQPPTISPTLCYNIIPPLFPSHVLDFMMHCLSRFNYIAIHAPLPKTMSSFCQYNHQNTDNNSIFFFLLERKKKTILYLFISIDYKIGMHTSSFACVCVCNLCSSIDSVAQLESAAIFSKRNQKIEYVLLFRREMEIKRWGTFNGRNNDDIGHTFLPFSHLNKSLFVSLCVDRGVRSVLGCQTEQIINKNLINFACLSLPN